MGRWFVSLWLLAGVSAQAGAAVRLLDAPPSYPWYRGCGPTAAGMVLGYWDSHGYPDLIVAGDGSADWSSNADAVRDVIASPGHIRDYVPTPDRQPTPTDPLHPDDSIADFMLASRDPLGYGQSYENLQSAGLAGYAAYSGYDQASAGWRITGDLWSVLTGEIDADRPVELFVDPDADGTANHFVVAFGYDDTPGAERFAFFDPNYVDDVRWRWFGPTQAGRSYGVRSVTTFDPGPAPAVPGDVDGDGEVGASDIDALSAAIAAGSHDPAMDLTGDGAVDVADLDWLVCDVLGAWYGDFDLDGAVDGSDLGVLGAHWVHDGAGWSDGNGTGHLGDDRVDGADLALLGSNWLAGTSAPPVPEPAALLAPACLWACLARRRR